MTINSKHSVTYCFTLYKLSIKNCLAYSCVQLTVSSVTGTSKQSGPVYSMSSIGWQSRVLPTKLGSVNTGPMGPSNSGWVPFGTNSTPHKARIPHTIKCSAESMAQISTEVSELMLKGAIVEMQATLESFVSQLFLVEKKGGGQRPVVNLNCLNHYNYVKSEHFNSICSQTFYSLRTGWRRWT